MENCRNANEDAKENPTRLYLTHQGHLSDSLLSIPRMPHRLLPPPLRKGGILATTSTHLSSLSQHCFNCKRKHLSLMPSFSSRQSSKIKIMFNLSKSTVGVIFKQPIEIPFGAYVFVCVHRGIESGLA